MTLWKNHTASILAEACLEQHHGVGAGPGQRFQPRRGERQKRRNALAGRRCGWSRRPTLSAAGLAPTRVAWPRVGRRTECRQQAFPAVEVHGPPVAAPFSTLSSKSLVCSGRVCLLGECLVFPFTQFSGRCRSRQTSCSLNLSSEDRFPGSSRHLGRAWEGQALATESGAEAGL